MKLIKQKDLDNLNPQLINGNIYFQAEDIVKLVEKSETLTELDRERIVRNLRYSGTYYVTGDSKIIMKLDGKKYLDKYT